MVFKVQRLFVISGFNLVLYVVFKVESGLKLVLDLVFNFNLVLHVVLKVFIRF